MTTDLKPLPEKLRYNSMEDTMNKTILITGFQPFGGESINPSYEAVKRLPDEIDGNRIIKLELPVVFGKAAEILARKIEELKPDAVISVGQAGGRNAITPELIGVNVDNGRIPDNDGNQPVWEPISKSGPDGLFTRLPVHEMVKSMNDAGISASVSMTAGAYVCNDLMYRTLLATDGSGLPCGFIHVPFIPEQTEGKTNVPSIPLDDITRGLEICVRTLKL